jgi:hypothetical protein
MKTANGSFIRAEYLPPITCAFLLSCLTGEGSIHYTPRYAVIARPPPACLRPESEHAVPKSALVNPAGAHVEPSIRRPIYRPFPHNA